MGIYAIKPGFQRLLGGVEGFLVRRRVHPDYLTLSALAISLLGGLALYLSQWSILWLAIVPFVCLVRTALNALDGLVARATGLARPWGEVLNEVCDRVSDIALLAGLSFAHGADARLGVLTVVAALLSSYVGTVAKAAGGKRQYGGVMGKADRMVYMGAASVAALLLPALPLLGWFQAVMLAGLLVTIAQRLVAGYDDLKSLR